MGFKCLIRNYGNPYFFLFVCFLRGIDFATGKTTEMVCANAPHKNLGVWVGFADPNT
jgi:hypothetical protein